MKPARARPRSRYPPPPGWHLPRRAWGFIKCLLRPARCREVDRLLYQYAEHELDGPTHRRLQRHLAECPACREYVETYRRVVFLTRAHGIACGRMPPELERRLLAFLDGPL